MGHLVGNQGMSYTISNLTKVAIWSLKSFRIHPHLAEKSTTLLFHGTFGHPVPYPLTHRISLPGDGGGDGGLAVRRGLPEGGHLPRAGHGDPLPRPRHAPAPQRPPPLAQRGHAAAFTALDTAAVGPYHGEQIADYHVKEH